MKKYEKKPWTREERALLEKYYGTITVAELQKLLPDRTDGSIRKQVSYLRKRGWRI
jgi:hypothetical protein|tara:strand:- start:154 stop:321 length:168 start_codon:yes stop_codon:yes gene_type:complete